MLHGGQQHGGSALAPAVSLPAAPRPALRGADGLDTSSENNLPGHWIPTENVPWKVVWSERAKGDGPNSDSWSSMVISGDRVYLLNQSGDCVLFRAS